MNKAGQAVLVARLIMADNQAGPALKMRFLFGSGWTDAAVITPGNVVPSGIAAAINERGDAIAMYSDGGDIFAIRL